MKWYHRFVFGAVVVFCASFSFAQENTEIGKQRIKLPEKPQAQKLREPELQFPEALPVLEHAVDPQTYIVGPGDRFFIHIPTYLDKGFETVVTAEGKLIIPSLGVFQVAEKTLVGVQKQIQAAGKKMFLQGRVYVNLIDLRFFRVHVLGEVVQPGLYAIRQTYRVSDAIREAGGASDWANLHAIEIRRRDGNTQTVDLTAYNARGDLAQNPQVLDGDVIFIPRVEGGLPVIHVQGRIPHPGLYFAKPNETADDFLKRISGATRKEDLLAAVIKRPMPGKNDFAVFPLFPSHADGLADGHDPARKIVLQDGDILSIPSVKDSVYVQGAVLHPGAYPYYPNFLARDYAGLAGPNEKAAGPDGLRVYHEARGKKSKGSNIVIRPGDTVEVPTAKRIIWKDYLQIGATVVSQVFTFFTIRELLRRK